MRCQLEVAAAPTPCGACGGGGLCSRCRVFVLGVDSVGIRELASLGTSLLRLLFISISINININHSNFFQYYCNSDERAKLSEAVHLSVACPSCRQTCVDQEDDSSVWEGWTRPSGLGILPHLCACRKPTHLGSGPAATVWPGSGTARGNGKHEVELCSISCRPTTGVEDHTCRA